MSLPIKLKLPAGYLDPEVRDGYTICEKQKKIWAVELDLLNEFYSVCKKHDIKAHICFGTLLGAVRHKGFIPWDDDADVWMTRDEFRKLEKVSSEFKHPYFFQTIKTDPGLFINYARLRNSLTTAAVAGQCMPDYNSGIFIDIDILDGDAKTRLGRKVYLYMYRITQKFIDVFCRQEPGNSRISQKLCWLFRPVIRLIPYRFWVWLYEETVSWFNGNTTYDPHQASSLRRGWRLAESEIKRTINLPFEMLQLPAPAQYDEVLKKLYGDYMQFPELSERGAWHEGIIHFEPDIPYTEYLKDRSSKS